MTEKRLDKFDMLEFGDENEYWIVRCNKIGMANEEVVELLNLYEQLLTQEKEKNQLLKLQLSNISAQRDEFHRGARENANRVGKLKKENEELKQQIKDLRITVLDNIHKADEVQCNCNPCVVEKYVKKAVE